MKGTDTLRHLRNYFFTGLLVVLPVFVSIKILLWLFELALGLTSWMLVFFPPALRSAEQLGVSQEAYDFYLKIFVFLLTLAFIVLVGMATRYVLGKRMVSISENLIMRVPLLNKIYGTVKQITQTLWTSQKTVFSKVVLVEYPRPGAYALGFITSESKGEVQKRTHEDVVNVFIPTTPNPTSGWLAILPRSQVKVLDMTVADGFKMVISGGSVVPPYSANSVASAPPATQA
jgi:uncharacterized membrane protein